MNEMHPTASGRNHVAGKTVVITGASDGIGAVAARELAAAGANVVLAVRNPAKARAISRNWPGSQDVRTLDLASLQSVRDFAADWSGEIDILINNAGVFLDREERTADGLEAHFGVNHLGHFELTNLLLDRVTDRVITLTSELHRRAKLDVTDLSWNRRRFGAFQAYCDSKLANLLFTAELQRRLHVAGSSVVSVAAHPGLSKTNLFSGGLPLWMRPAMAFVATSSELGAQPTLYAASQPLAGGSFVGPTGITKLRGRPGLAEPSAAALDPGLASALWAQSALLTAGLPAA